MLQRFQRTGTKVVSFAFWNLERITVNSNSWNVSESKVWHNLGLTLFLETDQSVTVIRTLSV